MSENLLHSLYRNEIQVHELKDWLSGKALNIDMGCTHHEFITYFLTYVRNASSRYVPQQAQQPSAVAPLSGTSTTRTPNRRHKTVNSSYESNTSMHTSTPKRRPNKSLSGSEAFHDHSQASHNRHASSNLSFDHKNYPTLENYLTFSSSKENIAANQKKKKKGQRRSQSPSLDGSQLSCDRLLPAESGSPGMASPIKSRARVNRRIKPTILTENCPKTTIVGSNSYSFNQSNGENISGWHRSILREEREKIAVSLVSTPTSAPTKHLGCKVSARLAQVTHCAQLDALAAVYGTLLERGLVLSPLAELHLLLTLLLASAEGSSIAEPCEPPLASIHNCVYLAASTLATQVAALSLLNRATLRLLAENDRLREFAPKLALALASGYERKAEVIEAPTYAPEQMTYVSETDSRDNFPSECSFHTFRKQRDAFYELLRCWQLNRGRACWSFSLALAGRVRALFSMHAHPANHCHLARLLSSQLLATGDDRRQPSDSLRRAEDSVDLLDVSSDKLDKLKNRLVNKDTSHTHSDSDFPGLQEFYKEFIDCAQSNVVFLKHVEDSLAHAILTLEDNFYSDESDADCNFDSASKSNFISFLRSTKLLAKFLGYIEALPYRTAVAPQDMVLKSLLSVRRQARPALDLERRLQTALAKGRVVLTVPWVVEYLSQLDYVSLRLPAYERVLRLLVRVQCGSDLFDCSTAAALLVRLCLGGLFESPNFPRQLYYSLVEGPAAADEPPLAVAGRLTPVTEQALYLCVPRLLNLRALLATGAAPLCMRYIRPVTAAASPTHLNKQREQKQLEDVFFHGHPESVKRLVDFASERIASAIVRMIKKIHVEHSVAASLRRLQCYIDGHRPSVSAEHVDQYATFLRGAVQQARLIAEEELASVRETCKKDVRRMATERCDRSIPALLPHDVHPLTALTCISVAAANTTQRVLQWLEQSLNIAQLMDPLTKELGKLKEDTGKRQEANITHYSTIQQFSVVKLLNDNKMLMFTAHETPELLASEDVLSAMQYTRDTVRARKELGGSLRDAICTQVVDLAVTLIISKPELAMKSMTQLVECLATFAARGGRKDKKKDSSVNVVNARNVCLVSGAPYCSKSWGAYKAFILALLAHKLLSPNAFEEQVLKLFQQNLPETTFNNLVMNLQEILDDYGSTTGCQEMLKVASCLTAFLVGQLG